MYSLEYIVAMNNKATQKAQKNQKSPYIAKCDGDVNVKCCPLLGDFIPEGWQKVNEYFVDSSGFGREDEIALTFEQFLKKVKKDYGYTIGEVGQFQLYINEYKKQ